MQIIFERCVKYSFLQDTIPSFIFGTILGCIWSTVPRVEWPVGIWNPGRDGREGQWDWLVVIKHELSWLSLKSFLKSFKNRLDKHLCRVTELLFLFWGLDGPTPNSNDGVAVNMKQNAWLFLTPALHFSQQ